MTGVLLDTRTVLLERQIARSGAQQDVALRQIVRLRLGLALCRRIVEAHDGRITLGKGPGGAVVLTLPREPQ